MLSFHALFLFTVYTGTKNYFLLSQSLFVKMPEGPEIRSAANFINKISESYTFTGSIVRGPLPVKLPTVDFRAETYSLRAEARGKELKVIITWTN